MKNIILKITIASCLFGSHLLYADLLAGWDFNGVVLTDLSAGSAYELTATTIGNDHLQATLSLGAGVNPSTTAGQYGFKIAAGQEQSTLGDAIAAQHYIEILLTVDEGYRFDLMSIDMKGESSGTGANNVALLSSIGGFTDSGVIATLANRQGVTGGLDTDGSGWGSPISFTENPNYQGLQSAKIRIYGWNTGSDQGITYLRNLSGNDLGVNGSVIAIPEPAVLGFITLSGVGLLIARRFSDD